jgi:hypothetical protein
MGAETTAVEAGAVLEELLAEAACVFLALDSFHTAGVAQGAPNILRQDVDVHMASIPVVVGVRGTRAAVDHSSLVEAVPVAGDRDRRAGSHCHNHMNTQKVEILPSCRLAAA